MSLLLVHIQTFIISLTVQLKPVYHVSKSVLTDPQVCHATKADFETFHSHSIEMYVIIKLIDSFITSLVELRTIVRTFSLMPIILKINPRAQKKKKFTGF